MNPRPGEVWFAELGPAAKTRPVVIVSRNDPEAPRALVVYVPLTTLNRLSRHKVPIPRIPFLHQESVANVQGLASILTTYLKRRRGRLSNPLLAELKRALAFALEIE